MRNDLWKFDPSTNEWAWMNGSSAIASSGVYGALGVPAPANVPGARASASGWTDHNGNFWMYGGWGLDSRSNECYLNDLWEFNPSTNEWAWIGGIPFASGIDAGYVGAYGTIGVSAIENTPWSLFSAATWTDSSDHLWMFGGGAVDPYADSSSINDMWEFYPSINEWALTSANSASAGGTDYATYGTLGVWSPKNIPGERNGAVRWTDSQGNFWLFGGAYFTSQLDDLWEFKPSINQWAWVGGSDEEHCSIGNAGVCTAVEQPGVYGTLGVPGSGNIPGSRFYAASWTDSSGNLWLFGGNGNDSQGTNGYLNDLWEYSFTGSPTAAPPPPAATPAFSLAAGTYPRAQQLTISDQNPGATIYYTTDGTTPGSGSTAYGGPITVAQPETVQAIAVASGYALSPDATANYIITLPPAAPPAFSVAAGTYASAQTVSISDTTPNSVVYYTLDGRTPTTSSTQYTAAITVSASETVEAIAVASGYATSAAASAAYTITYSGSFTLSASPSALTVNHGGQATVTLTVTPQNAWDIPVSFACSGLPAGAACTFSPATLYFSSPLVAAETTTLTISVSSQSGALRPHPPPFLPLTTFTAGLCLLMKKRRRVLHLGVMIAALAGLGLAIGCGSGSSGGSGSPQTPVTSNVTVTATGATIQQTASILITVN